MRIHLNHGTPDTLLSTAARTAGVAFDKYKKGGSRSHFWGYTIILEGESGRHTNSGSYGARTDSEAATWDQWGIFLAVIFEADPGAKTDSYANAEDFHRKTGGRFDMHNIADLDPDALVTSQSSLDYKITAHRWTPDFENNRPLSGHLTLRCKGHGTKKNKRAECHARLVR